MATVWPPPSSTTRALGRGAPTGSLTTARLNRTATLLTDGKVLVAGRTDPNATLASVELYDPSTGTWSATASMTTARDYHTATLLADGKVLVAGGHGPGERASGEGLAAAEVYDQAPGPETAGTEEH